MEIIYFTLFSTTFLFFLSEFTLGTDTISQRESITDGKILISKDESFELGFFSPGTSTNRYVGIWYKWDRTTVVWVANRQNPIKDLSGLLMINGTGHLVLFSQNNIVVWSANQTEVVHSPLLQLLDSGNLVLRDKNDENAENCVWQSFDYPSDTLLPGMKLGWDLRYGLNRRISAWKSPDDPSPGDFIWGIELHNYPEAVMWKGSAVYFRSGQWNGLQFSGGPDLKPNPLFGYEFVSNENEVYYVYHLKNKSVMSRIVLNQTTYIRQRYAWNVVTRTWGVYASVPRDNCDQFGLCGAYGDCIIGDSPICQCLKGFQPKSPGNLLDWSGGCVRNKPLNCQNKDASGFSKVGGLKLPDSTNSWLNEGLNIKECRAKCLNNCSCTAYTNSDIRGGGSGCVMWFGDLIDMRQFPSGGQEIYIRMHVSELGAKYKRKVKVAVMVLTLLFGVAGMMLLLNYIRKLRTTAKDNGKENRIINQNNETQTQNLELFFDLATIANATSNFSARNKLGEGGFGPVYSGTLEDGKEIAVKRLSKDSGQGQEEFKNEVILIANLQHRNLVKLLGSCIQRDERLLIYEYMPNKSLDCFIFDHTRAKQLDWSKRFNIISGIARGLLYLHQDSRLRIIHRDLKASNVLLDYEMNPKISDFGVARSIRGDQGEENTNRIIGTYGYMAPEYAISGKFSVKSDVFSFGILLLEIISGKKNKGFYHLYPSDLNLIGHAWRLWKEGRALELIDPNLDVFGKLSEALRSIHVGLLCVQERPVERPSMSDVVVMLASASALPQPKQPGFSLGRNDTLGPDDLSTNQDFYSTNEITLTLLEAR